MDARCRSRRQRESPRCAPADPRTSLLRRLPGSVATTSSTIAGSATGGSSTAVAAPASQIRSLSGSGNSTGAAGRSFPVAPPISCSRSLRPLLGANRTATAAPIESPSRIFMSRFIAASLTGAQRLASRTGARSRQCVLRKNGARTLTVYSPVYGLVQSSPARRGHARRWIVTRSSCPTLTRTTHFTP